MTNTSERTRTEADAKAPLDGRRSPHRRPAPRPGEPAPHLRRAARGADPQPAGVRLRPAGAGAQRGQDRHRRPPAPARGAAPRLQDGAGRSSSTSRWSRRACSTSASTRSAATGTRSCWPACSPTSSTEDLDLSLSGFADDEVAKLLKTLEHREKRERAGVVRPRRRAGGRTCGTTRPTWRALGAGRPPPALRRRLRHSRRDAPLRRQAGSDGVHRPALQRQPRRPRRPAARRSASAASRTTPCRRRSGRRSAGAGPATSSPPSTAPSTSA